VLPPPSVHLSKFISHHPFLPPAPPPLLRQDAPINQMRLGLDATSVSLVCCTEVPFLCRAFNLGSEQNMKYKYAQRWRRKCWAPRRMGA